MSGFVLHMGGRRPYSFAVGGSLDQDRRAITSDGRLIDRPPRFGDYVIGHHVTTRLLLESVNPIPRRVLRLLRRRRRGRLMADGVLFHPEGSDEWTFDEVEQIYEGHWTEGDMGPRPSGRVRLRAVTCSRQMVHPEQIV